MADIAASDVTATRVSVNYATPDSQRRTTNPEIEITADIKVSTATNTTYERDTGIPLTNLFTTSNASDLGLDVSQAITLIGGMTVLRKSATDYTVGYPATIKHTSGSAPSLILFNAPANAAAIALNEVVDDADLTAATVAFGAAGTHVARVVLRGTLRNGVSLEDLGGQK